jgi:hypothetical protein
MRNFLRGASVLVLAFSFCQVARADTSLEKVKQSGVIKGNSARPQLQQKKDSGGSPLLPES